MENPSGDNATEPTHPHRGTRPPDGDENRAVQLITIYWVLTALALTFVVLRFYARIKIKGLGRDDWAMLLCWLLFMALAESVTRLAMGGGARHMYYLTEEQVRFSVKQDWSVVPLMLFVIATAKVSTAALMLRMLGPNSNKRKFVLYFIAVTSLVFTTIASTLAFEQCNPPSKLWSHVDGGKCWNSRIYLVVLYVVSGWSILSDVVLTIMPITIISRLHIQFQKKVFLCSLFGLGLVATVFSIIKMFYLVRYMAKEDFTWEIYDTLVWHGAEGCVMIICGSIPAAQPIWDRLIRCWSQSKMRQKRFQLPSHSPKPSLGTIRCGNSNVITAPQQKEVKELVDFTARTGIVVTTEICVSTEEIVYRNANTSGGTK